MNNKNRSNYIYDGMYGLAVGDALGVPFETASLEQMRRKPCTDMVGNGFHKQPAGTWSDDTSMSLCVADSLSHGFDPEAMMKRFVQWKNYARYTAGGKVFDIGNTCKIAINRYQSGYPADMCGNDTIDGNGNGALMRMFPMALYQCLRGYEDNALADFLYPVHESAKLTHAHAIGLMCCGFFSLTLREWLERDDEKDDLKSVAMRAYCKGVELYDSLGEKYRQHLHLFSSPEEVAGRSEDELPAWGYALNTWNIALWSLLTTQGYRECVLKAVGVGGDTDTNAAVAGALAGVVYGKSDIPKEWLTTLRNCELIESICDKFNEPFFGKTKTPAAIESFQGEYAFLLLKNPKNVCLDGTEYQNAAAAFYAQCVPEQYRAAFRYLDARKAYKLYKQTEHLPADDASITERLAAVLRAQYALHQDLREKLLATEDIELVYNTSGSHDNTLGCCKCPECADKVHKNLYGKALMALREQLREQANEITAAHENSEQPVCERISTFREKYYFLSNFYPAVLCYDGIVYLNAEAAYQAQKCADKQERSAFARLSADEAKRLGRKVEVRADWDDIKLQVMEGIVLEKFTQNPYLAAWLLETGETVLEEGNRWGDVFWGINLKTGEGENNLGKILMRLRTLFRTNRLPAQENTHRLSFAPEGLHMRAVFGDITQSDCMCIVNPANPTLLGGGGVDGAIHAAAGAELLEECRQLNGCRTGEAKLTKAYRLKAQYIIHTVGPHYPQKDCAALLEQAYRNSLELAMLHHITSIAFPAISTGKYSYPKKEAVAIAVDTVHAWLCAHLREEMKVDFTCTDWSIYEMFCEQLKKISVK